MADRKPSGQHAKRCRELARILIPALREVARRHGYALGVHGSLAFDIDLIAAPWATHVTAPRLFAEAIGKAVHAINGAAFDPDIDGADEHNQTFAEHRRNGSPGLKPHGRLCWVFHLGGGPYVDLSVVPPPTEVAASEKAATIRKKRR